MSLFQSGRFSLHTGESSPWKIECDALTEHDWKTLAVMAVEKLLPSFGQVIGVPTGGYPFEQALKPHITVGSKRRLIVDDVLTTGSSMNEYHKDLVNDIGLVVFARGEPPWWVTPLFKAGWL